ncbi:MAG: ABC transporter ATP-binding protein [Halobacteriales archaeon]|nr:ABC transporter ATP-binding protein [Halobacteriales archaeon]
MPAAIEVRGLTKVFDRKRERGWKALRRAPKERITAVDHVDLAVEEGELFGLLGPNAAGKTTLVKVLATLLLPTEGTGTIAGLDIVKDADAVRQKVGVVLGGDRALYWRLTARENLWYFSQLYNMPDAPARKRIDELLGVVGLTDRADERVENYSKGMKQRLHIARGLLHDPSILLLDEPTIGLDPHAARSLRALVRDLVDQHGRTVVLTTHYMYEADQLSDRVAIINKGRIVACDTPAALKLRHAQGLVYLVEARGPVEDALRKLPGVQLLGAVPSEAGGMTYRLRAPDAAQDRIAGELAEAVQQSKGTLLGLRREEATLEDVFVELTGSGLREERGGDEDE